MRLALAAFILAATAGLAAANPSDNLCHTVSGGQSVEIDVGIWGSDGHLVGFELTPLGHQTIQVPRESVTGFWFDADLVLLRAHDDADDKDSVLFKYDRKAKRGRITVDLPGLHLRGARVSCDF
jgi:hypothetical protein